MMEAVMLWNEPNNLSHWDFEIDRGGMEFARMNAAADADVTITYCFTPDERGVRPHHTSPPRDIGELADFCARMTRRYAG